MLQLSLLGDEEELPKVVLYKELTVTELLQVYEFGDLLQN